MRPVPRRREGWRAAAALLLALSVVPLSAGCGKPEKPPAPPSSVLPEETLPSGAASAGAGQPQEQTPLPPGTEIRVIVVPSSPSRITPPTVSVESGSGPGAELEKVLWFVDGSERGAGKVLSPTFFRRGDRIHAVVTLRTGDAEREITTPEVVAGNALPAVESVSIDPRFPVTGARIRAVVSARDPDEDPLTFRYQWYLDNVAVPGDGDAMDLKGVRRGSSVHVRVTPNDGFADGAWRYSPVYEVGNASPVVRSEAPTSIPPSRVLVHTIVAEDPDGDPLTYTLEKGPEGMSLSGPTLTWKVTDEELDRPSEVAVRISDSRGGETLLTMTLTPRRP